MAQTAEERKIKRLESEVKRLKDRIEYLEKIERHHSSELYWERDWRRKFQSLLKEAVQEDDVKELETW